ncbi:hypothetical protein BH11ACT4_BH11ACT4_14030 [soil metagenome]
MEGWTAVGSLWDRALAGDAAGAAAASDMLLDATSSSDDRAILIAFRSFCELTLCDYSAGAATAERAAAVGAVTVVPRFYVDAMRLLAAAMGGAPSNPPDFDELRGRVDSVAELSGPDALLALHPFIESAMATGRFDVVAELVAAHPPVPGAASEQVATWVRLQFVRSRLFAGQLDVVATECADLATSGATARYPQVGMLVDALLCYAGALRADRSEVDKRSALVLAEAKRVVTYVQVGSCLLVSWSFSAIGQVQRAAALLLATAGGPGLSRIKTWDRAFGYELLITAALQRHDLAAARGWAERAAPLARFDVAAAAVQRGLSRVAAAAGDPSEALDRATVSAAHDSASGARIEELHSHLLIAGALAASGSHREAIENLGATARAAERLGAASVRHRASRQLRLLTDRRGGWESLTDREREIAGLVAEGHSNRAIASTLFISDRTVQSHVSRTLRALGATSRSGIPALVGPTPSGSPPELTPRQQEVARLVAIGRSNDAIAAELGISAKTVEKHLAGIFERWGVSSRTTVATIQLGRS